MIIYRFIKTGEEIEVCSLVNRVFDEFVAPDYGDDGVQEFRKYVNPPALLQRGQDNHIVLVAAEENKIVGIIEIRNNDHISLLFVDAPFQGRGISRTLTDRALEICRQNKPTLTEVTVNSSLYALPIYKRLGFQQTQPEQVINGIRFVPMALKVL